ncbi:hypothetical protein NA57DRAFT_60105 [Rhizodiscina lignyota]|uniref:Uncharacterized protein n=1 Tax=Rhizodiscina lignyota TaxID=1504668 RepID=A0A9P4I486_9PEZI|nr:hypothetical protein NA57DRAFT_60105 [Rhizodiscina lignyota]
MGGDPGSSLGHVGGPEMQRMGSDTADRFPLVVSIRVSDARFGRLACSCGERVAPLHARSQLCAAVPLRRLGYDIALSSHDLCSCASQSGGDGPFGRSGATVQCARRALVSEGPGCFQGNFLSSSHAGVRPTECSPASHIHLWSPLQPASAEALPVCPLLVLCALSFCCTEQSLLPLQLRDFLFFSVDPCFFKEPVFLNFHHCSPEELLCFGQHSKPVDCN